MKYLVILADGMAGLPIDSLGGKTTIQAANKSALDKLATLGRTGLLHTVPPTYEPGSEVANLAVMGYDLDLVFEGRGSLEAASMGVDIEDGEMAMRCNLITLDKDGLILNHSAGHISTEEAKVLIDDLQQELADDRIFLFAGVSYRNLLKLKGGNKALKCTPPHDVPGTHFSEVMMTATAPEAEQTAKLLNEITLRSQTFLADHPINKQRIADGKEPANSIWLWSPGYKPAMQTLSEKYGIASGSVISAVDLIRGIGVYAGLKVIEVEGATGLHDTNYEGKSAAAIEALKTDDYVYLHIEASDEAGHEGDAELKIRTVEYLNDRVVAPIMEAVKSIDDDVTIALLPDHPTPCCLRTHTREAIPFVIYNPLIEGDSVTTYDEYSVIQGHYGELHGEEFMDALLNKLK
ncbi:MAG: cofactor-independent phosphoglycerate mutase [Rikenellaceae bacterium]